MECYSVEAFVPEGDVAKRTDRHQFPVPPVSHSRLVEKRQIRKINDKTGRAVSPGKRERERERANGGKCD